MVSEVFRAVLKDCGVTSTELLDLIDASAARGEEVMDTRWPLPATGTAARLPAMMVWPADDQTGFGPHLHAEFELPDDANVTISDVRGYHEVECPGCLPETVMSAVMGERLSRLVTHPLLDECEIEIVACRAERGRIIIEITMPLVPLVELPKR